MSRFGLLWPAVCSSVFAADAFRVTQQVLQGELVRVEGRAAPGERWTARWRARSIPLFPQADGTVLGLMPIPVTQAPGAQTLEVLDSAGQVVQRTPFTVRSARYPIQNIRATPAMQSLKPLPGEVETMRAFNSTVSETRHWRDTFAPPVPQCANSSFGVQRYHNGKATGNYHRGLDLRSPAGQPILAANDGVVRVARMFGLHGGTVGIDHGQGVITHYLHMSKLAATEGAAVKQGDLIGYVGATGFATGPHLHWGLYVHGVPTNPMAWTPGVKRCPVK